MATSTLFPDRLICLKSDLESVKKHLKIAQKFTPTNSKLIINLLKQKRLLESEIRKEKKLRDDD